MATKRTKKTTPKPNVLNFPWAATRDFRIISQDVGDGVKVYGVENTVTGHIELMFTQVSAAVINMQTAQQTFDRVRSGEANGYFEVPAANG